MPTAIRPDLLLGWPLPARSGIGFTAGEKRAQVSDVPYSDASEAHCLVVAPTGAGKGVSAILPNLLHWRGAAVVLDFKGEAAMTTARYRKSLGQRVHYLDPFRVLGSGPDCLNPLDWLRMAPEHLADNATTLSELLTGQRISKNEPFWDDLANELAAGLLARAATHDDPAMRSIGAVYDLLTAVDMPMQIAAALDHEKGINRFAYRQLASFLTHERDKVLPSVRSTAQQHLRIFANPLVQEAVSRTTMSLAAFQRGEPVTLYLVLPATRLHSHAALLRVWLAVLLGLVAERKSQPEAPTLLVLDELAQLGGMPLILQALTLLRGYGLRVMAVLQSLGQLKSLWPQDYQTVLDNCGTVLAFGQTRPTMARPMAELFGDLSEQALLSMPQDQLAIGRAGQPTVIARKLNYLKDPMFAGRFDANGLYRRGPQMAETR